MLKDDPHGQVCPRCHCRLLPLHMGTGSSIAPCGQGPGGKDYPCSEWWPFTSRHSIRLCIQIAAVERLRYVNFDQTYLRPIRCSGFRIKPVKRDHRHTCKTTAGCCTDGISEPHSESDICVTSPIDICFEALARYSRPDTSQAATYRLHNTDVATSHSLYQ